MDVRCEKCGTEYEFDENRIGPNGVTVKCTNCGHVFKVRRAAAVQRSAIPRASTAIGAGPQGKEWLVRKPDGQMIAFRELTTLQKWIVEGRISRDDEISKNGETWKRLGNIMELEPFFSVYEKAQTLNSLIEQQPVELRGSELLAAVNPLDGGHQHAYPIPSRSQILQADPLPSQLPSQVPQPLTQPAPSAPAMPAPAAAMPAPALPGPAMPAQPLEGPAADRHPAPRTGLAGPGALERSVEPAAPPASFQSATLDFPVDDDEGDDPVASFERGQRNRRVLVGGLILVCLGLGASAAVAMYGPDDNPLRGLAVQYGLLETRPADDGANALVEQARQEADRDTVASQTKAIDLLGQALGKRPSDLGLLADRALQVALLADAYDRAATDLDVQAKAADEAIAAWTAQKKKDRGPKPQVAAPEQTRIQAQRQRARAEKLLGQAEPWLKQVEADAKGTPKALRARAGMSAAAHAADQAPALEAAKAAANKEGRTDPVLLYLEARAAIATGESGYVQARTLLGQAMTARPSFLRARSLSARLHLLQGKLTEAKADLAHITQAAPAHEEAKRLEVRVSEAEAAAAAAKAAAEAAAKAPAEEAAPKQPKGFDYWLRRADRLRRADKTTKALNAYGRAAELRPNSAEVHVGKGWCLMDLERPHPALAAFERAIRVNGKYAEAYYGKGEALRTLGRKDAAIEAYKTYLDRAPSGAETRVVKRRLEELGGS